MWGGGGGGGEGMQNTVVMPATHHHFSPNKKPGKNPAMFHLPFIYLALPTLPSVNIVIKGASAMDAC